MSKRQSQSPGSSDMRGTVIFGIGNEGRSDDGLGWAFLDRLQTETKFDGQLEYRYQLQVEDAALIRDADRVIFVDSCKDALPEGFEWAPCEPSGEFEFTSHVLHPSAVLYLCEDLYGRIPRAHLLKIRGSEWDLRIGVSADAGRSLDSALSYFQQHVLA